MRRCCVVLLYGVVLLSVVQAARLHDAGAQASRLLVGTTKQPAEVTIRLGSWNIEWLGNPKMRKKPAQAPEDIAKYILASKVDLLGLNEITHDVEGDDPRTNKILTEALAMVKKETGKTWKHLLFPSDDPEHKDLLCGVAWNDDLVKLVDRPFKIPVRRPLTGGENVWRRSPHAVKFSLGDRKTDVVLVPVHMKSNAGGGITQMSKVRALEANCLIRCLGQIQNQYRDDDLVILGDLNCLVREEPALQRFRMLGFRDLNQDDQLTWIKDRLFDPAPFDRFLVPEEQPEFRNSPFRVFREHGFETEKEYRERLSDHYMILTEIKLMDDDD
jgi:hypothetical protein